jgi:hypothetical protein
MKSLLLAAALTGVFLPGTALAHYPNSSGSPVTAPAPRPIPASIVKPTGLPLHFTRALINIEFTLDPAGQPRDIKVLAVSDPVLRQRVVEAFRQWRFETGAGDAAAGAKRFVLPIELRAET